MGKLYLNADNKIVVETDNGRINPDGSTNVEINSDETYTMNVEDIAMLLNIVNNQNVNIDSVYTEKGWNNRCKIISNSDITKKLEEKEDIIKNVKDNFNSVCNKLEYLRKCVNDFNCNKKIFWRPIKIKE